MATRTEAVDDILKVVGDAWTATAIPLGFEAMFFEDNDQPTPDAVDGNGDVRQWGRSSVRHLQGFEPTIRRGTGQGRYRQLGQLVVQVYSRQGDGRATSDTVVQALQDAIQGTCTPNGVVFRQVSGNEVGQSGVWYQVNVQANFEYDRIN